MLEYQLHCGFVVQLKLMAASRNRPCDVMRGSTWIGGKKQRFTHTKTYKDIRKYEVMKIAKYALDRSMYTHYISL
jgi:hypothetical protein